MTSTRSSRKERTQSQFNRAYFWELRNNRIMTLFYVLTTMIILPGSVLLEIISETDYYTNMGHWEGETVEVVKGYFANAVTNSFDVALGTGMTVALVGYILCLCGSAFSYMHTRRSIDLFHALPIRRTPLLLGKYFAALTVLIVPLVVGAGLCELLCVFNGILTEPFYFMNRIGFMILLTIASFTFSMLFMVISGTLPGAFLSIGAVTIGWPFTMVAADVTMRQFLPGYVSVMDDIYTIFSPFGAMLRNSFISFWFDYELDYRQFVDVAENGVPWMQLWWMLLTAVMLAVSIFYYNRRKSESAENYFSFPVIRGIIRCMLSIGVGLEVGLLVGEMLNSNIVYLGGIVFGAAITHIFYQFILTHSFKGFWKTLPAFCLSLVITGGFLYSLYTGGLGYAKRLPDVTQVEKVTFTIPTDPADNTAECYLARNQYLTIYDTRENYINDLYPVLNTETDVTALENLQKTVVETRFPGPYLPFEKSSYANENLSVDYTMKNGKQFQRNYWFYLLDSDKEILDALAQLQKLEKMQSYNIYYGMQPECVAGVSENQYMDDKEYDAYNEVLTAEEQERIWTTFVEEISAPDFTNPINFLTQEELELYQSGMADGSGGYTVEDRRVTEEFRIITGRIPYDKLTPAVKSIIEEQYLYESGPVGFVSGCDFLVPECCVKTRQLIHELTEPFGETFEYYEDEEWCED